MKRHKLRQVVFEPDITLNPITDMQMGGHPVIDDNAIFQRLLEISELQKEEDYDYVYIGWHEAYKKIKSFFRDKMRGKV